MATTNDVNTETTDGDSGQKRSLEVLESSDVETSSKRPKIDEEDEPNDDSDQRPRRKRWRVHQMAEDYVTMAGNLMYPGNTMGPYGYHAPSHSFPLERLTTLGMLTSPLRTPTVIETWSPYEISLFEASLVQYGKQFHKVREVVQTKSTKEIVAFYYMWKKTSHYQQWKRQYVDDYDILSSSDSSDNEGDDAKESES